MSQGAVGGRNRSGLVYLLAGATILGVSILIGALALVAVSIATALRVTPESGRVELPVCVTEDSANCYWDGGENGQGWRFVDVDGSTYYLPNR